MDNTRGRDSGSPMRAQSPRCMAVPSRLRARRGRERRSPLSCRSHSGRSNMRRDFGLAPFAAGALLELTQTAHAVDFTFDGFADFRLVAPAGERAWIDGGLGKTRYGEGDSNFQFGDAYGQATALL